MLKQSPYDGDHADVLRVPLHPRHDAGDTSHEQRALHPCLRGLRDLLDDVLVRDGVRLEEESRLASCLPNGDLLVYLAQDVLLDLKRRHPKRLVFV